MIIFDGVQLQVTEAVGPNQKPMGRNLIFVDAQSGQAHMIPMNVDTAMEIGRQLLGRGLAVASAADMPPMPPINGHKPS